MNEGERMRLNMTTAELDILSRLAGARREIKEIARVLLDERTSKRDDRQRMGGRLNAVASSLLTVEYTLTPIGVRHDPASPSEES